MPPRLNLKDVLARHSARALRRELAEQAPAEPVAVPVFRGGDGPLPGVDLRSNRALREVLDRGASGIAELR